MKTKIIANLFVLFAFVQLTNAQFTKLFDFTRTIDIQHPLYSQFVSDGTWLYATFSDGGVNNKGALIRIKPDGTDYLKLRDFGGNPDGANPIGALIISGTKLYGVTSKGGTNDLGCIFSINTDGTGYTKLLDFNGTVNGANPYGSLTLSSSGMVLYGMTNAGGVNDKGCLFKVNTDGTNYAKLKEFSGDADGANPYGSVSLSGNMLYGMTYSGGTHDLGCIFSIKTDGTGFTKLFDFSGISDGANPYGSLLISANRLYGTTYAGGTNDIGCVFKLNITTKAFTNLIDFDSIAQNGVHPQGSLIISDNMLYGMTYEKGGIFKNGTIFKIDTVGTGFTSLLVGSLFQGSASGSLFLLNNVLYGMADTGGLEELGNIFKINTDGTGYNLLLSCGLPENGDFPTGLTVSDQLIFGMTFQGGVNDAGCIYKINTDGSGYTKLFDCSYILPSLSDYPRGPLVVTDTTMYGVVTGGGMYGRGAIFKINTNGTGYSNLFSFDGPDSGGGPVGSLVLSDGIFYGMTYAGGASDIGTIFKINTDGTGYKKLLDFDSNNGATPYEGLTLSGGKLYGVTPFGGINGGGNVFKINTDGSGFTSLHDFNPKGASTPYASPVLIGSTVYGTTSDQAGNSNYGTLYKINTDGTGFTILKQFTQVDGTSPNGSLVAVGNSLYGMTMNGGAYGFGAIFKYNVLTSVFTKLYDFPDGSISEHSLLTYSSGKLYGALNLGGTAKKGALFSFAITPDPKIDPVITWNNPADITYGTLLDATQLNAKANVPGAFVYTPAAGTKLEAGNARNLKADFTPADTISYNKASKTVTISVSPVTGIGNLNNNDIRIYPNPFGEYIVIESTKSYAYVSVLDLNGKLITGITTKGQFKNTISLKNQKAGTYLVVIKDSNNKTLMIKQMEKIE